MGVIRLRRKITNWGHAYGIRVTKAELERLGLRPNDVADVEVRGEPAPVDWSHITPIRMGRYASERHDEIIGEGLDADR